MIYECKFISIYFKYNLEINLNESLKQKTNTIDRIFAKIK